MSSETVDPRRLDELRSLLRAIEDAGWEYARVEMDGVTLVVSSDADFADGHPPPAGPVSGAAGPAALPAPAPVPAPAGEAPDAPATPAPRAADAVGDGMATDEPVETVTSPTIGLAWRSPKPGAPPFVEVGDAVSAGDTLCIVEVMKLMTHVTAPVDGTVRSIRFESGGMVEQGTPLVDIRPSGADR